MITAFPPLVPVSAPRAHGAWASRSSFASTVMLMICSHFVLVGCTERAEAQNGAPPAPAVSVAPAVQRALNDREGFSGRLEAIEYVELRPRITGTIERVHFIDGALVRQGDLLFTIDPRPFEAEVSRAQAQLAAAEARSQLAVQELNRANALLDSQASSRQEVEQLTSGSRTSMAEIRGAEAARGQRTAAEVARNYLDLRGLQQRYEVARQSLVN